MAGGKRVVLVKRSVLMNFSVTPE